MWLWAFIAIIVVLVLVSAFFSGSETALTASSRARMHQLQKSGDERAGIVEQLLNSKERLIGALLLGNNLANILSSALATSVLIQIFGQTGVVYATIGMTALLLVFAEVLPKTWAITVPDRFSLAVAPIVRWVVLIFSPVVRTVEWIVAIVLRACGLNAQANSLISAEDELRGAVDLLHMQGSVLKGQRDMLGGLLDLSELDVSDVMVHRTAMQGVNADEPIDKIVDIALSSPYTRLPLWRDEADNIVGILHGKDLLRALRHTRGDFSKIDIDSVASPPWFVLDSTPLRVQLSEFLRRKSHFALVVDEYGEVMGLVTLEDIIEEIVGNISDEHDVAMQGVRPQLDGTILVDGSVPIRDLNRALDWSLPDEEATTIAGLVIHEAHTIPEAGQEFTFHNYRFKVLRKSRNRITQLRVSPLVATLPAAAKA
ncbi:Mg2+ and Co2+ transporter CorB, contains DUF21, CBS pair, and CorC-HlyC domains [Faunimonas pinastri]|uniref:Mg2+ and Co2+ transporter CorB, contains DUF21, CBS pair, and CorC-HlyC domains n=1 Tax=Faunimonas pinastri TaxID=1855383 RepID=A0A1H9C7Z6_9HYPH|nr:HlyC/CorC family transporter [Faunimonas pinastri]SEP97101.1 Mg2+ and Co2+ transporter CorB, contains DUF21, CBS pair, and CorC-HlyC domains [Faunimonas pinastri]